MPQYTFPASRTDAAVCPCEESLPSPYAIRRVRLQAKGPVALFRVARHDDAVTPGTEEHRSHRAPERLCAGAWIPRLDFARALRFAPPKKGGL